MNVCLNLFLSKSGRKRSVLKIKEKDKFCNYLKINKYLSFSDAFKERKKQKARKK